MPGKANLLLLFLLFLAFPGQVCAADSGACTKPKVAVQLGDFTDETYQVLQRQYPFQTKEYWLSHIQQKMLEKLKANSPGIEIFPMASAKEYDYYIRYYVAVIGCGEQKKIGHLLSSKDTCYWVHGTLYSKDACGLAGVGFRSASIRYKDIDTAVTLFALQMGNIETIAAAHERERPIPPRGPQIRIDKEPKPVSPLEGERETIVDARVTNCRGEPVYDKAGKRYGVVAGPKQGQRGETHPFQENASAEVSNWWSISPNAQGDASLKYKLTKGVKAGTETLTFVACGLGTKAVKKQAVQIDGLELRVKPQKTQIKPGESTRIDIEFAKVSVKGERKPIPGKELRLKIEGLKDGVVSPKEKISTNAEGRASLVYQAGQNDKTVKITAFYQPQGFPDRAESSAVINVQTGKGDLEVDIRGSVNFVHDYPEHRVSLVSDIRIIGTMVLSDEKHDGAWQYYKTGDVQMQYSHFFKAVKKVPDKNCPETLETEVSASGTVPVADGHLNIKYPRPDSRRVRQTGINFGFSQGAPGRLKQLVDCKYLNDEKLGFLMGLFNIVDTSPISQNQKEFSGKRSFGIDPGSDWHRFMRGVPFTCIDDQSAGFMATPPTEGQAKEIEKILSEAQKNLGALEAAMKRTWGSEKGGDVKVTWKIRKMKDLD